VVSVDWPKAAPDRNATKLSAAIARTIRLHH
jgi:hypothetical protein